MSLTHSSIEKVEEQLAAALRENAELKRALADTEALFHMLPVAIAYSSDPEAKQIYLNPAFAEMLGVNTGVNVAVLENAWHLLPYRFFRAGTEVRGDDMPLPKCARTGREVKDELEVLRADGRRFYIYGIAKPLLDADGRVKRAIGAFLDVTDRKKAEQDLERSLAATQAANQELQQFAYAASHDLQEPLRTISTYMQLLQRNYEPVGEAAEFMGFIVEAVRRMNTLVRDLLTYARTGASSKRVPVNLNLAVQWVTANLDQSIRETKAEITCDELPTVVADESQIIQLFQNVLSNALKYRSEEPPRIVISAEEGPEFYTISVGDNGIGIPPNYHAHVFGVFKRLHGREIPGTGLGLALCRKIVEGHGGKIWVESDGKHGSVFKFTLPT